MSRFPSIISIILINFYTGHLVVVRGTGSPFPPEITVGWIWRWVSCKLVIFLEFWWFATVASCCLSSNIDLTATETIRIITRESWLCTLYYLFANLTLCSLYCHCRVRVESEYRKLQVQSKYEYRPVVLEYESEYGFAVLEYGLEYRASGLESVLEYESWTRVLHLW